MWSANYLNTDIRTSTWKTIINTGTWYSQIGIKN